METIINSLVGVIIGGVAVYWLTQKREEIKKLRASFADELRPLILQVKTSIEDDQTYYEDWWPLRDFIEENKYTTRYQSLPRKTQDFIDKTLGITEQLCKLKSQITLDLHQFLNILRGRPAELYDRRASREISAIILVTSDTLTIGDDEVIRVNFPRQSRGSATVIPLEKTEIEELQQWATEHCPINDYRDVKRRCLEKLNKLDQSLEDFQRL